MPHPGMRLATDAHGSARLVQYFSLCGVWAVTPYSACDLRCSYCVTFSQGKSTPRLTSNVAAAVQREVQDLPPDATLAVGGLVDAYPSVEDDTRITREVLRGLATCGRPVVVITKGPTITRDIDFLLQGNMRVCISLSSLDDAALGKLEPYVAPATERMRAIETLCAAGVDVCLQAQPWIPGLTDAEAMIKWADSRFPISFTPLNVDSPGVARTPLGRQFSQQEINRAYLQERERLRGHPRVTWHKPLWVGTSELQARSPETEIGSDAERRNLTAIRRLLQAFEEHTQFEALLGFISPYVRGTDHTGHAIDANHPQSGRTYDLLYGLYAALEEPAFRIDQLQARDDTVTMRLQVSGTHTRPLFDIPPSGEFVTLPVEYQYIFDNQGLALEFIQNADLNVFKKAPVCATQMQ